MFGYHVYESSIQQVFGIVGALSRSRFRSTPKTCGKHDQESSQPATPWSRGLCGRQKDAWASMVFASNQGLDVNGGTGPEAPQKEVEWHEFGPRCSWVPHRLSVLHCENVWGVPTLVNQSLSRRWRLPNRCDKNGVSVWKQNVKI